MIGIRIGCVAGRQRRPKDGWLGAASTWWISASRHPIDLIPVAAAPYHSDPLLYSSRGLISNLQRFSDRNTDGFHMIRTSASSAPGHADEATHSGHEDQAPGVRARK